MQQIEGDDGDTDDAPFEDNRHLIELFVVVFVFYRIRPYIYALCNHFVSNDFDHTRWEDFSESESTGTAVQLSIESRYINASVWNTHYGGLLSIRARQEIADKV